MDTIIPLGALPSHQELRVAKALISFQSTDMTVDGVALSDIAESVGTPTYLYSGATLRARFQRLASLFAERGISPLIAYALKANDTQAVIGEFAQLGAGADVVSEGEVRRALAAGILPEKIVFSGVGKTGRELRFALECGVRQINIESREELLELAEISAEMGCRASVSLRVNPNVDAQTHANITTGVRGSKFGLAVDDILDLAERSKNWTMIALTGISMHIGSQILKLEPFERAFRRAARIVEVLRSRGVPIQTVDLGGGVGISYGADGEADIAGYVRLAADLAHGLHVDLVVEPGRWLVGPAGLLLCRVVREKRQGTQRIVVVDAGMNDLMRPALYKAWHALMPVGAKHYLSEASVAEVVGPVCETSDHFGEHNLPDLEPGDLLAFLDAGAYGATMSSSYNTRPPPGAVLVNRGSWAIARKRLSIEDLIDLDRTPKLVRVRSDAEVRSDELL